MNRQYALQLNQGGEDFIILYYADEKTRKAMLIALFTVREQVGVATWTEIDGGTTGYREYSKHNGSRWVV